MGDGNSQLLRMQQWFHAAITHPDGCRGSGVDDIVLPSKALNSTQRLSIYADMYFVRLIEIMGEDFPTVRHLLGTDLFSEVAKDYVTRYPSTHYSLAHLGKQFPQFLLEDSELPSNVERGFAVAVATVERNIENVFDEQQDEPLSFEEIQSINADNWDRIRLKPISALRLLRLPYSVNDYISAVRKEHSAVVPSQTDAFLVVYRRNYRVWRSDIDARQFVLLSALFEGQTLGESLAECAEIPGFDTDSLATSLVDWFRDWATEGYFTSVSLADDVIG